MAWWERFVVDPRRPAVRPACRAGRARLADRRTRDRPRGSGTGFRAGRASRAASSSRRRGADPGFAVEEAASGGSRALVRHGAARRAVARGHAAGLFQGSPPMRPAACLLRGVALSRGRTEPQKNVMDIQSRERPAAVVFPFSAERKINRKRLENRLAQKKKSITAERRTAVQPSPGTTITIWDIAI